MADGPDATKKTAQAYNDYNNSSPFLDKLRAAAKSILGSPDDETDESKNKPPLTIIQALTRPFK